MTTAGARLATLAGASGTAGALLMAIGAGATAGARLVAWSGRSGVSAGAHLMTDRVIATPPPAASLAGGIGDRAPTRARITPLRPRGTASGSATCTGRLSVAILAAGTSHGTSTATATPILAHLLSGRASGLATARARARVRLDTHALARAEDAEWMLLL